MSSVGFFICYLTVCFSLCGFAGFVCLFGGVLCYSSWFLYFTTLVLLEVLQPSVICKTAWVWWEYLVFHVNFYKHWCSMPIVFIHLWCLCLPCLLDCALLLHLQPNFPSSCEPSHSSAVLPAVDVQHPAPLNPRWLWFFSHHPCSQPGYFSLLSLKLFLEQGQPFLGRQSWWGGMRWLALHRTEILSRAMCSARPHPAFWENSGPRAVVSSWHFWLASVW